MCPLKIPLINRSFKGKPALRVFACFQKNSRDGASLAFCGREFQSLGAATEKALSCLPTKWACASDQEKAHKGRYILKDMEQQNLGQPLMVFLDIPVLEAWRMTPKT